MSCSLSSVAERPAERGPSNPPSHISLSLTRQTFKHERDKTEKHGSRDVGRRSPGHLPQRRGQLQHTGHRARGSAPAPNDQNLDGADRAPTTGRAQRPRPRAARCPSEPPAARRMPSKRSNENDKDEMQEQFSASLHSLSAESKSKVAKVASEGNRPMRRYEMLLSRHLRRVPAARLE